MDYKQHYYLKPLKFIKLREGDSESAFILNHKYGGEEFFVLKFRQIKVDDLSFYL